MHYRNAVTQNNLSQSQAAIQIEKLVQVIGRTDRPAFEITQSRSGYERVQRTRLSRYFDSIQPMINVFEDCYPHSYSEHLQVFWQACQGIGVERSPAGLACLNESNTGYLSFHQSMNVLVARIRQLTGGKAYRRKEGDRRYEARQKAHTATEYVGRMLDRYSRTVVTRVNLYYRKAARIRLRVEDVFDDLDRLINARERSPIFEYETGYICCMEQGEDMGFHIHAAFFFNGAGVRRTASRPSRSVSCGSRSLVG